MKPPSLARDLDWPLMLAGLALSLISLVAMKSATMTLNPDLAVKQAIWAVAGVIACLAVASVPYPRLIDAGVFGYLIAVAALLLVLIAGTVKLGAARWVTIFGFSLQPSELAKLATACVVARYLSIQTAPIGMREILWSASLVAVPSLLIFLQPDLGSSTVLAAIWFGAAFVAGMPKKLLGGLAAALLALLPCAWMILKDYQRTRLMVFINPGVDPLGAGYTIIQSKITIGSGQWLGRGWMSGTQSQLSFLPERHSDFLYSVVGEEWGFLGSVAVVLLFGLLVWRMLKIAQDNSDAQGRYLATALASWIAYQAVVNMGMVMGVLPVVGVPLPMVSYGGSAMVATWVALGILQSIRRFGTRF